MERNNKITIITDQSYELDNDFKYSNRIKTISPLSEENIFSSAFIIINFPDFYYTYKDHFNMIFRRYPGYNFEQVIGVFRRNFLSQIRTDIAEILDKGINIYVVIDKRTNPESYNYDSLSILLPIDFSISSYKGKEQQCLNANYLNFYTKLKDLFSFNGYFKYIPKISEKENVSNIFCIENNPKRITGLEWSLGKGKIILLPYLNLKENLETFIEAIIDFEKPEEKPESSEYVFPEWSNRTTIPYENETIQEIEELNHELKRIKQHIFKKNEFLSNLLNTKILFTGDGAFLEDQCLKIFIELGFKQLPVKKNRSDLVLSYNNKPVVVEVKGLKKSAAERNSAQIEKWVSEYIDEHDKIPKAILIINGYKDTTLDYRNQPVFPHSMVEYSKSRKHCLISGIQLACIYYEILEDPSKKDKIVDKLLNTVGVFEDYKDWKNYIKYEPEA